MGIIWNENGLIIENLGPKIPVHYLTVYSSSSAETVRVIDLCRVHRVDRHWRRTADDLIALFRTQIGKPASVWETALDQYEGARMYVVIRGLAKVLWDAATFAPLDARERLFAHGPALTEPDCSNYECVAS
ncbi:MAG: DUF790 family protein [Aggregatilineales bacterium]